MSTALLDRPLPEPVPTRAPRLTTGRSRQWLLVVTTLGCMLLSVSFGPGLVPGDPLVAAVIFIAFGSLGGSGSEARQLLVALAPWMWLVVLGSTLALLGVGLQRWALDGLLRDAFVLAFFFAAAEIAIDVRVRFSALMKGVLLSIAIVSVTILLDAGQYRPKGTFENPNYAGHFLVLALLLLLRTSLFPVPVKAAATVVSVTALFFTGSFGSVVMLSVGGAYLLWARLRTHPHLLSRIGYGLLLSAFLGSAVYYAQVVSSDDFYYSNSVNSDRIDRSAQGRVTIWRNGLEVLADHPLGVGPAGLANRDLLGRTVEIHNDYLGYLIERGPLAVIGLAGFAVVLWRRGGRHGATRLLIVTIAVGMATRETLHFRHLWLFLAFAFAYDVRARRLTT
jgi:O-antigen ligase